MQIHSLHEVRIHGFRPLMNNDNVAIDTTYQLTNRSGQNIFFIVKMRAGSGDINFGQAAHTAWKTSGKDGWKDYYTLAGANGTMINLTHNNNTYTALGGRGSKAGLIRKVQRFYYWSRWDPYRWDYTYHWKIAREGQILFFPLLFKKNEVMNISFTCYGAKDYEGARMFHGQVLLTPAMFK